MSSLRDRRFLVTGVSRPSGIGATLARRLAECGAVVAVHGNPAYDLEQQYPDAGVQGAEEVIAEYRSRGLSITRLTSSDLGAAGAGRELVDEAVAAVGPLTDIVLNHAHSTQAEFGGWTEDHIDAHLTVNLRASMMIAQRFAEQFPGGTGGITLMTSGQYLGPMIGEVAYAVSKEGVRNLATHLSVILAPRGIRVNCVNPGPTDTGYLTGDMYEQIRQMFPFGRWGRPSDVSRLIEFLHSDEGSWIVGQCIGSEGGFVR